MMFLSAGEMAARQKREIAEAQKLVDAGDAREYFELSWGKHYVYNGKVLKCPRPIEDYIES